MKSKMTVVTTDKILKNIYKSGLKILIPLDLNELYATVVKEAIKLVNAEFGSLILEENQELKRVYSTLPYDSQVTIRKRGFTYQAYKQKKAFVKHYKIFRRFHPELSDMGIKSNIFIPLSSMGRSFGVLIVNSSKEEDFTSKELDILKIFGSLVSLAIHKTQLYHQVNQALETRDLFISMAAHEFRTPLTTISGYTQLLNSKLSGADTAESKWVDELNWETSRLTHLVNELLQAERIKLGQLNYDFKECSLKEIINRAVKHFLFTHPERKIIVKDLVLDKRDMVVADFDKILQVIINLLDNAAKFSPPSTDLVVILKFKTPNLIFIVKDQGKGIAKEDLPKIFDVFYRGKNSSHKGMGLGLFLTKHIIGRHNGNIDIRSNLNKGTQIEIKLPRAKI